MKLLSEVALLGVIGEAGQWRMSSMTAGVTENWTLLRVRFWLGT